MSINKIIKFVFIALVTITSELLPQGPGVKLGANVSYYTGHDAGSIEVSPGLGYAAGIYVVPLSMTNVKLQTELLFSAAKVRGKSFQYWDYDDDDSYGKGTQTVYFIQFPVLVLHKSNIYTGLVPAVIADAEIKLSDPYKSYYKSNAKVHFQYSIGMLLGKQFEYKIEKGKIIVDVRLEIGLSLLRHDYSHEVRNNSLTIFLGYEN